MTDLEADRFDMLCRGPCVTADYVRDYYGLPWPLPEDVRQDYESWAGGLRRRPACGEGRVSRFELEAFMQQKDVIPKKWMAARLGMVPASLDEVLAGLHGIGMRAPRYVIYADLIATAFSEDIIPNLPGLKFRTFSNHNSFCERLHAELKAVLRLEVRTLFCATSDRMGEDYPRQFASHFDCVTMSPLSLKHQVWLDFRKPMNLPPDRCSKLFYAENRGALHPFAAGTREPDVSQYEQFLAGTSCG